MGVMEGSFCPTSFAATNDASKPERRGLNLGLQQSTFALFGLGFGPIIATQLLTVVPSWRWVFFVVAIPGLILGALYFSIIREAPVHAAPSDGSPARKWSAIFKSRNIVVSMAALFCAMTCVFVLSAMVPSYLVDYLHLSPDQMGFVTSALGFGGFAGQLGLPGISDFLGRKPVAVGGFAGAALLLWAFIGIGPSPAILFAALFVVSFFCLGLVSLLTGPISSESAPRGLISSAIGIVVGSGEIFGGGVAPSVAGYVAQHYGIQDILYLALAGVALGMIVYLALVETAPRKESRSGDYSRLKYRHNKNTWPRSNHSQLRFQS